VRAVTLLSGGLDSILAAKVILEQGVELEALNFRSVFCTDTPKDGSPSAAAHASQQLGIRLKVLSISEDLLALVKDPKHGYGRHFNPCIDCRILTFRKAGEYRREIGAAFIVTGEVLGERPMSQRREAMRLIEKESGLEGLIVRPLSAVLLEPSRPEKEGWIDRSKLLGIKGRSRKPQIALARSYGLDYPWPAGGCLLTDPGFAGRLRDLMTHDPGFSLRDVQLLKVGRHFRLSPQVKVIVGRDEGENEKLSTLSGEDDVRMEVIDLPSPITVLRGPTGREDLLLAASITARYSKAHALENVPVGILGEGEGYTEALEVQPANEDLLARLRIERKGGRETNPSGPGRD